MVSDSLPLSPVKGVFSRHRLNRETSGVCQGRDAKSRRVELVKDQLGGPTHPWNEYRAFLPFQPAESLLLRRGGFLPFNLQFIHHLLHV
jgi:hypothetical protein